MPRFLVDDTPMTVAEFLAFTATRPDEERWELIEGEPVLNASASLLHQIITGNIIRHLGNALDAAGARFVAVPGIGFQVSEVSAPVPDVIVRREDDFAGVVTDDVTIAFEVLSPSTASRDLRWKRRAYAGARSLRTYVIVAQDVIDVVAFDRAADWAERRYDHLDQVLDLPSIGVGLPLRAIYAKTGLATPRPPSPAERGG